MHSTRIELNIKLFISSGRESKPKQLHLQCATTLHLLYSENDFLNKNIVIYERNYKVTFLLCGK